MPGIIILLSVPDKNYTFRLLNPISSIDCIVSKYLHN
ncbi:hypothetical protein EV199_0321 [Pseudobacter ginsenosidimutans]|uniref:Uncharacterized protein n=1 Tax=Pseudobacter ginsenosidimutans TaxID=661488 RepID=A0A4Q7MZS9_9BACT|nr:hypothetical protein EV199_0321 [Pseudobacter ginsenosidimutans]